MHYSLPCHSITICPRIFKQLKSTRSSVPKNRSSWIKLLDFHFIQSSFELQQKVFRNGILKKLTTNNLICFNFQIFLHCSQRTYDFCWHFQHVCASPTDIRSYLWDHLMGKVTFCSCSILYELCSIEATRSPFWLATQWATWNWLTTPKFWSIHHSIYLVLVSSKTSIEIRRHRHHHSEI